MMRCNRSEGLPLQSSHIYLRLDAAHGGEILELVDLRTGRQLLGFPPFPSRAAVAGDLDEWTWTNSYRGGWQLLTPNAGNRCTVEQQAYGFHGRASVDPWTVRDACAKHAELVWRGNDLEVCRRLVVSESLTITTTWSAFTSAAIPFVCVEHLALGRELVAPSAQIRVQGGKAYELSETSGPTFPPDDAGAWPLARLQSGVLMRHDRCSMESAASFFGVITALEQARFEVTNDLTGQGLRVEWDKTRLPHLWIWKELRSGVPPWGERSEMVMLEPSSVPHSLGLAHAIQHGQAYAVTRHRSISTWITVTPFLRRPSERRAATSH